MVLEDLLKPGRDCGDGNSGDDTMEKDSGKGSNISLREWEMELFRQKDEEGYLRNRCV